jgi:hypothetical protein
MNSFHQSLYFEPEKREQLHRGHGTKAERASEVKKCFLKRNIIIVPINGTTHIYIQILHDLRFSGR